MSISQEAKRTHEGRESRKSSVRKFKRDATRIQLARADESNTTRGVLHLRYPWPADGPFDGLDNARLMIGNRPLFLSLLVRRLRSLAAVTPSLGEQAGAHRMAKCLAGLDVAELLVAASFRLQRAPCFASSARKRGKWAMLANRLARSDTTHMQISGCETTNFRE
jgi:hypothetical protein